jgi:serine/threonine protein phosphatase PrpC
MGALLSLEFHSALDTGRARRNNEDAVLVDPALPLCVLADGMGGYNAGEVASDMTVREVREQVLAWAHSAPAGSGARGDDDIRQALGAAAQSANRKVFDAANSNPAYQGMGTTLVIALFEPQRVWIGHIGDSRAYRLRAGVLEQISRDHSLLQEQIDAGLLTEEEAAYSMHRNLVTRAVGVEPEVDLELHCHPLHSGDVILLCSDGLSDMLPDAAIAHVMLASENLALMANNLVQAANDAGGRDNISVILAQAKAGQAASSRAWWPFRR